MYRLLNVDGRPALEVEGQWFDLATLSGDPSLADPMVAVARAAELHDLSERCTGSVAGGPVAEAHLGAPAPAPRQVFGIGLNYDDHAEESGMDLPPAPLTFTKFASCIAGPTAEVPLSGELVDWEAELVAVIGVESTAVPVDEAWGAVAGLMLGQDISDRAVQLTGNPAQFCLGKSFAAYGPTGPALVSVDSFEDPDDIGLWCDVSGERMQHSRSRHLIFSIPVLVAYLSSITTLYPGDLIFTGTPAGVGRLVRGDSLLGGIDGLDTLRTTIV